VKVHL